MKKLFYLPVAFMFLMSSCDRQLDNVEPSKSTASGVMRGIGCPSYVDIALTDVTSLYDKANCPLIACDNSEPQFITSKVTNIYTDVNNTNIIFAPDFEGIVNDSYAFGIANKPALSSCNGTIITKYFYSTRYHQVTRQPEGVNLTVSYWCCVAGGGGGGID